MYWKKGKLHQREKYYRINFCNEVKGKETNGWISRHRTDIEKIVCLSWTLLFSSNLSVHYYLAPSSRVNQPFSHLFASNQLSN
jgi:hypothetical protein